MGTDVADGYGCFVGRVVEIVGESCIRVGTPVQQRKPARLRPAETALAGAAAMHKTMRKTVTHGCANR